MSNDLLKIRRTRFSDRRIRLLVTRTDFEPAAGWHVVARRCSQQFVDNGNAIDTRTETSETAEVNGAEFERRVRRAAGRSHAGLLPARRRAATAASTSVTNSPPSRIARRRLAAICWPRCARI